MKIDFLDKQLYKFLLVGIANTIVGCGVMFLLFNIIGCSYWFSSIANYVCGGIVSFFLNRSFTFKCTSKSWTIVVKFVITVVLCYILGYGLAKKIIYSLLDGYSERIRGNIALCLGMILYVGLNYLGQRYWAFKTNKNINNK